MFRLNEFYRAVLTDWVDQVSLTVGEKNKIYELVRDRMNDAQGNRAKFKRVGEEKPAKSKTIVEVKEIITVENREQEEAVKQVVAEPEIEQQDDERIFNEEVKQPARKQQSFPERQSNPQEQLLDDISCSSQDILQRIENQINLQIFGVMSRPRKNKLSLLHLSLDDALIKGNGESIYKKVHVKLEVELYSNQELERLLIKKS